MRQKPPFLAIALPLAYLAMPGTAPAAAQTEVTVRDGGIEEVVVVGSRRRDRSAADYLGGVEDGQANPCARIVGAQHPATSPRGVNGGFHYLRAVWNFD